MSDLIDRQNALDALKKIMFTHLFECGEYIGEDTREFSIMNAEKALDVIENLPSAEPESKWIPVAKALPKNHEDVLVYGIEAINNKCLYAVKCWDVDTWRPLSAPSVSWIAWQPLPEPWEGE